LTNSLKAQNTVCLTIQSNPHSAISGLSVFTKYIEVFGVKIFATPAVTDEDVKHCAAVMAEYLDNDEDGVIDNQLVVDELVAENASMVMFGSDGSADQNTFFNNYNGNWALQDLYGDETHPAGSTQVNGFDATLEEVLHIITGVGYASAYPAVWGENAGTSAAVAMDSARGGHFTSIPNPYPAAAWYHYDDVTCNYNCMLTEYVYWSLTTLLGAQDYPGRCGDIANEWELCTSSQFQSGDVLMTALLTDPTYKFAAVIPDGNYCPGGVGIDNRTDRGSFEIYPNPTTGALNISLDQRTDHVQFSVLNAVGQVVLEDTYYSVASFAVQLDERPGIYFVSIKADDGRVIVRKFIVE
jgi:hypothetical protein